MGSAPGQRQRRAPWVLPLAAVLLSVATASLVVLLPLGTSQTTTAVANGDGSATIESTTSSTSLLDSEGRGVLAVALVPAVISAGPLLTRSVAARRRALLISTVLLGGFVVLGALSIGLAYFPTLLVLVAAMAREQ